MLASIQAKKKLNYLQKQIFDLSLAYITRQIPNIESSACTTAAHFPENCKLYLLQKNNKAKENNRNHEGSCSHRQDSQKKINKEFKSYNYLLGC